MNPTSPVVITLVSGKGGVGKTMLSVAVAKELSLSNRTLIVDLDFFNRGLTGLMGDGPASCDIDKPGFLSKDDSEAAIKWNIVQVAPNLFHIKYPDLLPEEMQRFETMDVNVLRASLEAFIREAAEKCNCDCVVLDCHGGPDNSSFAACLFSDYSLMISEPDRITFYGTLNFLRQLRRIGGERDVDLHLVFNKVVPAFSGLFLRSLYNRLIKEHFADRPLLAIFPLEVYLTKEFEKTPFLTTAYPNSLLARKTRTLLYDLLTAEHAHKLPPPIKSLPKWIRWYTKLTLGKQLPILNMNVVMSVIVIVIVLLAFLSLSLLQFFPSQRHAIGSDVTAIQTLQCASVLKILRDKPDQARRIIEAGATSYDIYDEIRVLIAALPIGEQVDAYDELRQFISCVDPERPGDNYSLETYRPLNKRKAALKNLNPASVPPALRNLYYERVNALQNTNRFYLFLQSLADSIEAVLGPLAIAGAGWLGLVLLTNWSIQLDRRFTYHCRLRNRGSMWGPYVVAIVLWFLPLIALSVLLQKVVKYPSFRELEYWLALIAAVLLIGILASFITSQAVRAYRDVRYEGHYVEDLLRAAFLAYLLLGPLVVYLAFLRP